MYDRLHGAGRGGDDVRVANPFLHVGGNADRRVRLGPYLVGDLVQMLQAQVHKVDLPDTPGQHPSAGSPDRARRSDNRPFGL